MTIAHFADLEAIFRDGYTSEDITRTLDGIAARTGVQMVCVWEVFDDMYHGDSQLFYLDGDGLRELASDLWSWLLDGRSEAPRGPGDPTSWAGERTGESVDEFPLGDGRNYARVVAN